MSRPRVLPLIFALSLIPCLAADAQPASFPTEWLMFDSDPDEGGAQNDFRDVSAAFWNVEDGFLFLRLQTIDPAGWPSTGPQGTARYKFFFDTANADGVVSGGNINDAEFLLMLEDLTLNTADPTLTRDLLGELTFLDDLANVGFTARWDSTNPPKYTTNAVGSPFWRRELGSGTPGTGGPQGVFGTDIGYRIDGDFVDVYVDLDLLGNPTELRLLWATDQMNTNLDQAPNVDRPEEGFFLLPLRGTIEILKNAVPDSAQAFSFTGDLGSFSLTDDGVTPAIETFALIEPGQYDVTETVPAGWTLGSIVCDDPDAESTGDVATATASIELDPGETVSCLFVNEQIPPADGMIVIVKDAVPDGAQSFSFTGDLGAFNLTDDGPIGKSITFTGLAPGVYDVTETPIPAGWDLAAIVCDDPSGGTTVDVGTATASIDVAAEETVTCTFVDEQRGSITIVKDALPDDPTSFDFTGDLGAFALEDDGVGASGTTFTDLLPGTYDVTEVVPAGWLLVQIDCVDPDGGSTFVLDTATATIDLDPGEAVTCTFTDALPATLEIIKNTEPDDPQDFAFTSDLGPFTLDDPAVDDADGVPQSITFTDLAPFPILVTEEVPAGWALSTVVCNDPDGGSSFEPATQTLTADLDPGETVSCTFVNVATGGGVVTGTIVVAKDAVPDSAQVFDFTGSGTIGAFQLEDDGVGMSSATFTPLTAGTYTITETVPAGWTLGSLVCEDPDGETTVNLATATATIDLDPGETVTCLFTDTEQPPPAEGSITIVKDAQPDSAQSFGFTGDLGAFSLTDQGTGGQSVTFPGLAPGSYQVTEQLPAGWNLAAITCVDPDQGTTVSLATATATIDLDGGESVTCTFVDTSAGGTVTIVKDAVPEGAQGFQFITDLGAFILTDDGTGTADSATFTGVAAGSYDVTEVVPDGWMLSGLTCNDPDQGTTVDPATATATVDLDPGETITCTFFDTAQPGPGEGTVIIVKDAQPNSTQVFSFAGDLGPFDLVDDGMSNPAATFTMVAPGTYAVSELIPTGWALTDIVCVDPDQGTVVDVVAGDALIDVDGGETITCTFVNGQGGVNILAIPTASTWALVLLGLGLGLVGLWTLRNGSI